MQHLDIMSFTWYFPIDILYTYIHTYIHTYIQHTHTGAIALSRAHYGNGSGLIHLNNINCRGSESRLVDCPYNNATSDCTHSEDAGVYCPCKYCTNQNSMACVWCRVAWLLSSLLLLQLSPVVSQWRLTEHFLFMRILVTQMLRCNWTVNKVDYQVSGNLFIHNNALLLVLWNCQVGVRMDFGHC